MVSNNLRVYPSMDLGGREHGQMDVTAFVGGEHGYSVQFTIGGRYCALAENQVRDLMATLQKRVRGIYKYQATSCDLNELVFPLMEKGEK